MSSQIINVPPSFCRNRRIAARRKSHGNPEVENESIQRRDCERSNARVELLLGVMIEQFGGTHGFLAAWSDYHHRAMHQGGFHPLAKCRIGHPSVGRPRTDSRRVCGRLCSSGFRYAQSSRTQPSFLNPILSLRLVQELGGCHYVPRISLIYHFPNYRPFGQSFSSE